MNLVLWALVICLLWGIGPICQKSVLKKVTPGAYFVYAAGFIILVEIFYIWYYRKEAEKHLADIHMKDVGLVLQVIFLFTY